MLFTGIKHLIRHKMSKKEITKIKQYIKDDRPQRLKSYVRKHHIDLSSVELKHNRNFLHYCCQHGSGTIMRYRKKLKKNSDTWKIAVIVLKFDLHGLPQYTYMCPKDANRVATQVDPDRLLLQESTLFVHGICLSENFGSSWYKRSGHIMVGYRCCVTFM